MKTSTCSLSYFLTILHCPELVCSSWEMFLNLELHPSFSLCFLPSHVEPNMCALLCFLLRSHGWGRSLNPFPSLRVCLSKWLKDSLIDYGHWMHFTLSLKNQVCSAYRCWMGWRKARKRCKVLRVRIRIKKYWRKRCFPWFTFGKNKMEQRKWIGMNRTSWENVRSMWYILKTYFIIFPGMSSPWFLPCLCTIYGL